METNFVKTLFFVGYDQYPTRAKINVKFKASLNNSGNILYLSFIHLQFTIIQSKWLDGKLADAEYNTEFFDY